MQNDNAVYRLATDTSTYLEKGIQHHYLWNPSLELLIGGSDRSHDFDEATGRYYYSGEIDNPSADYTALVTNDWEPEVYSTKGVDLAHMADLAGQPETAAEIWPDLVWPFGGEYVKLTLDEIRELLGKPGWIEPCNSKFAGKSFVLDFEGAVKASKEQTEAYKAIEDGLTGEGRAAKGSLLAALVAPGREQGGSLEAEREALNVIDNMMDLGDYYNPSQGLYVLTYTGDHADPGIAVYSTPLGDLRDYGEGHGWGGLGCSDYYMSGPGKTELLYMPLDNDGAHRALAALARSIAAEKDKWVEAGELTNEFVERCEEMTGPQKDHPSLSRDDLEKSARDAIWEAKKTLVSDLRDELGESDRDIIAPGGSIGHISCIARAIDILNMWNAAPLDNFDGYFGWFSRKPDDESLGPLLTDPEKLADAAVSAALAERRDLEHDAAGRDRFSVRLRDALRCELNPGKELPATAAGKEASIAARSIWDVDPDDVKEAWRNDYGELREMTDAEAHELAVSIADNVAYGPMFNEYMWDFIREQLDFELAGLAEEIENEKKAVEPVIDMDIDDEGFGRE